MGGLQKNGVISKGSPEEIERAVTKVIKDAPKQFILGAECTVPGTTDWKNLRHAIRTAHGVKR